MTTENTAPKKPVICAGAARDEACYHFNHDNHECRHPDNMTTSLVTGKPITIRFTGDLRHRDDLCGPAATWYKPAVPF